MILIPFFKFWNHLKLSEFFAESLTHAARTRQIPAGPGSAGRDAQAQAGRRGSRRGNHRSGDAGEATGEGVGYENWFGRKGFETLCVLEEVQFG